MTTDRRSKSCQSCGMPLRKDRLGWGTNAGGSRSVTYCSHCYKDGRFTWPDITMAEMQEPVRGKLKEMGFPGFVAGFFTRGIPRLERWSGQDGKVP